MQKSILARCLRKIADAIEKVGDSELTNFDIELKSEKTDQPKRRPAQKAKTPEAKKIPSQESRTISTTKMKKIRAGIFDIQKILEQLQKATDREMAFKILDNPDLTRIELVDLARLQSVHVTKDDSVSRIKEKLVEMAIGSRLNSLAIRGK